MKKFNELTTSQKIKRLKTEKNLCITGKWLSILSPYIIIGAVNFNEYFTEANGVKMSLGCILACVVGGIAIYNEAKDTNKKISGIVGWAIAWALAYLLNSILADLSMILFCGLLGQLIGKGFELGEDSTKTKYNDLKSAYEKAELDKQLDKELNNSNSV